MSEKDNMEKVAKIENTIKLLDGELRERMQDFVDFLFANDFQLSYNPNEYAEGTWRGVIRGAAGDLGYMAVNSLDYMAAHTNPKSMMFWLNYDNLNENDLDNEMKEVVRQAYEIDSHHPIIINPDAATLEGMKKLLLMINDKEIEKCQN